MKRLALLSIAYVCIGVALLGARPHPTPGPALRDFEAYWSAGSAWNARADPYSRAIWKFERSVPGVDARREETLPYVGPPAAIAIWAVLARIGYAPAAFVWTVAVAVALLVLVAAATFGSAGRVAPFSFAAALALAIGFGPVTSDLALGQCALVACAGAAMLTIVASRSTLLAATAACVALMQPNVSVGLVSQLGCNRATVALAGGAIVTYLLGAAIAGWAWPLHYAALLPAHARAERLNAIQFNPAAIAYALGAGPFAAGIAAATCALLAIGTAYAIAARVRDPFARFAAFSALAPFVVTFFHEHDFVAAYAAAVWCALRTHGSDRAIALVGTVMVAVDWLGLAQRPDGIVQSALLAVVAMAAFVALEESPSARYVAPAAALLAVIFVSAAWLARMHPAPLWPDALGAFHANAGEPIATVWANEQRVAGLMTPVPAWAVLRMLPLFGCVLLAVAIYRRSSCYRTA